MNKMQFFCLLVSMSGIKIVDICVYTLDQARGQLTTDSE
jgi:hypothetical protein